MRSFTRRRVSGSVATVVATYTRRADGPLPTRDALARGTRLTAFTARLNAAREQH